MDRNTTCFSGQETSGIDNWQWINYLLFKTSEKLSQSIPDCLLDLFMIIQTAYSCNTVERDKCHFQCNYGNKFRVNEHSLHNQLKRLQHLVTFACQGGTSYTIQVGIFVNVFNVALERLLLNKCQDRHKKTLERFSRIGVFGSVLIEMLQFIEALLGSHYSLSNKIEGQIMRKTYSLRHLSFYLEASNTNRLVVLFRLSQCSEQIGSCFLEKGQTKLENQRYKMTNTQGINYD